MNFLEIFLFFLFTFWQIDARLDIFINPLFIKLSFEKIFFQEQALLLFRSQATWLSPFEKKNTFPKNFAYLKSKLHFLFIFFATSPKVAKPRSLRVHETLRFFLFVARSSSSKFFLWAINVDNERGFLRLYCSSFLFLNYTLIDLSKNLWTH